MNGKAITLKWHFGWKIDAFISYHIHICIIEIRWTIWCAFNKDNYFDKTTD